MLRITVFKISSIFSYVVFILVFKFNLVLCLTPVSPGLQLTGYLARSKALLISSGLERVGNLFELRDSHNLVFLKPAL